MTKKEQLQKATQQITYLDVVRSFNDLNKTLHGEYYCSSEDLITPDAKRGPGFVYTGYAAGTGIRKILDMLGIKYTTHMQGGSGVDEQSEIHITDPKSKTLILDIFKKCGRFQSNVSMELDKLINNANNPLLQNIR